MAAGFAAQVGAWATKVKALRDTVYSQSMVELVHQMQTLKSAGGNMPRDSGYLRASLRVSFSSMPTPIPGSRPEEGVNYPYSSGPVSQMLSTASYGQVTYIGYTAEYANIQELHNGFVRLAAQNWRNIVAQVVARYRI